MDTPILAQSASQKPSADDRDEVASKAISEDLTALSLGAEQEGTASEVPLEDPDNETFDLEQAERDYDAWFSSRAVCPECQSIFDHWYARSNWEMERPQHEHLSLDELQVSALTCPICELFLNQLDVKDIQNASPEFRSRKSLVKVFSYSIRSNLTWSNAELHFKGPETGSEMCAKIDSHEAKAPEYGAGHTTGRVARATDHHLSWARVKNWLKECQESHFDCKEIVVERKLPARLVVIGSDDSELKLCLSKDLPITTEYLTLSHCWGRKIFTTLTTRNLKAFLRHIPVSILTKTFQEAIVTTRILGFRYLWIDSLCIIQQNREDWERESALMVNIYANSTLNLAAIDAPNGDTGCFFRRYTSNVISWKVTAFATEESPMSTFWDCFPCGWEVGGAKPILYSRAWVFQERFLAPRSLLFGIKELGWHCRSKRASESLPISVLDQFPTVPGGCINNSWRNGDRSEIANKWFQIVFNYSGAELTISTDKLVAISGVARLFQRSFGTTYLAGMWREDILRQLPWYIDDIDRLPRDEECMRRAPSWSWVSTNSEVNTLYRLITGAFYPFVTIEACFVDNSPDPFVNYNGGYLRLRCQAMGCGSLTPRPGYNLGVKLLGTKLHWSWAYPDSSLHAPDDHVYYLPLFRINPEPTFPHVAGIMLQRVVDSFSYIRVGSFHLEERGWKEYQNLMKSEQCMENHELHEPASVDEDGNRFYIVTIV